MSTKIRQAATGSTIWNHTVDASAPFPQEYAMRSAAEAVMTKALSQTRKLLRLT